MFRDAPSVALALVALASAALHGCGGCLPRQLGTTLEITLTDAAGARVTDATVDCSALPTGEGEAAQTTGDGVYYCGRRGGRYSFHVYWRGGTTERTVDAPGDYCHSPGESTRVSVTLVPPPADAGTSGDASTDGAVEQ